MSDDEFFEHLEKTAMAFMIPLRMIDGLDRQAFDEFCRLLEHCATLWKDQDMIHKNAAMLFIDLYPAMMACAELYPSDELQDIYIAADHMADLIRQCFLIAPKTI